MGGLASGRSLEDARSEHKRLSRDLADLQQLVSLRQDPAADLQRLQTELDGFLAQWGPRLTAHLEAESLLVSPRVGGSLPEETGVLDTFRREGELFSAVLQLLREGKGWLEAREPGAEAGVAAAVRDLSCLWEQHLRRVEILAPLLTRLEARERA